MTDPTSAAEMLRLLRSVRSMPDAQPEVARVLGVTEGMRVRTLVSLGYATESGARPKSGPGQARRPLDTFVRQERFGK